LVPPLHLLSRGGVCIFLTPTEEQGYTNNPWGITDIVYKYFTKYGILFIFVSILTQRLILSQLVIPGVEALLARGRLVTVGMA